MSSPNQISDDQITRDREDPTYQTGEDAVFSIQLGPDAERAHVCLSNDGYRVLLQQPIDAHARIAGSLETPGILRCRVNWL
ncbi:MAG TPA: hypothetical protein QF604_04280, partial [Candidatus Latescibacteria bacterium]|nr:hypothetical protein [Candidatus Latescibacterota bacterium]